MIEFELPFPDRRLSPNAQKRAWYNKEQARKDAFESGYVAPLIKYEAVHFSPDPYHVTLTFFMPNKRKHDLDNLLASMKPMIDGVCKQLGIDDSQFEVITLKRGEVVNHGKVIMRIEPLSMV